jgi:hypothetical protein
VDQCKPLAHGVARPEHRGRQDHRLLAHGRAVQIDPIKPALKAPRSKRLELRYDELLSNVAFKFDLRRYIMDAEMYDGMSTFNEATPGIARGMALHKMLRLITAAAGGEGYLNFMAGFLGFRNWGLLWYRNEGLGLPHLTE